MIKLACDTSTLMASVALEKEGRLLTQKSVGRAGSHSDVLNDLIQTILTENNIKLSDVDVFITGNGPGSFTGIRISLNAIKTLGYLYQKPCVAVNSLQSMAMQVKTNEKSVTAMINAYKNMVYFAEYQIIASECVELQPPIAVRIQELKKYFTPESLIIGDGFSAYENYLKNELNLDFKRDSQFHDYPLAADSLLCVKKIKINPEANHWSKLQPMYIRDSEAEENARGFKYQPI